MAIDLTKARLLKSGDIVTPKGRLMWPNLFKPSLPKGETDEKKAQYQANLLLPKAADLSLLMEAVNACITDKWGPDARKKYKIKMPFKKVEEEPKLSALAADFPVMIRAWSKDKPGTVYADPTKTASEEDAYSGRWGCVMLRPFAWEHPTGGKGVAFGLQHVQLLDHDEPLAGARIKAEDGFESIDVPDADDKTPAKSTDDLWDQLA